MARIGRIGHAVAMRPTTRRILTATISAALLVSACSSGDDEAESTTTVAPITTTAPETTAAPTTTDAPTTTAPDPTTTTSATTDPAPTTTEPAPTTTAPPPTTNPGDPDWIEITQGLLELIYDLRAEPDVLGIEDLCFPGDNNCRTTQGAEIELLVEEDWRVVGAPEPQVLGVTVVAEQDLPGGVRRVALEVEVVSNDLTGASIVDSNGKVVQELSSPADTTNFVTVQVMQDSTGTWKALAFSTSPE